MLKNSTPNGKQTYEEQNSEADVCVLLGVFNSAETWRQFHTGHNAEGMIAISLFLFSTISQSSSAETDTLFLWCSALQLHKQADMQEEKNRIERVLGAISAPDLIQKVLNFALSVRTNPFFGSLRKYRQMPLCFSLSSEKFLNSLLSPQQDEVRPQDTVSVIGGVAGSSKQGRKAAWKFVKDNWEELFNRYQGGFLISRLVKVEISDKHQRSHHPAC